LKTTKRSSYIIAKGADMKNKTFKPLPEEVEQIIEKQAQALFNLATSHNMLPSDVIKSLTLIYYMGVTDGEISQLKKLL
jgi:hypothetical protein